MWIRLMVVLCLGALASGAAASELAAAASERRPLDVERVYEDVLKIEPHASHESKPVPGADRGDRLDLTESISEIVFHCSYVNFAWGHHHTGYYVDRDGGVHRYESAGCPGRI